jgi:hypothetical protein
LDFNTRIVLDMTIFTSLDSHDDLLSTGATPVYYTLIALASTLDSILASA